MDGGGASAIDCIDTCGSEVGVDPCAGGGAWLPGGGGWVRGAAAGPSQGHQTG
jgi:hypothetical protein